MGANCVECNGLGYFRGSRCLACTERRRPLYPCGLVATREEHHNLCFKITCRLVSGPKAQRPHGAGDPGSAEVALARVKPKSVAPLDKAYTVFSVSSATLLALLPLLGWL